MARQGSVVSCLCVLLASWTLAAVSASGFQGTPVAEGSFSHVVSVRVDGKHVNVGVIISQDYVLTEGWHYVNHTSPEGITVRSGSVDALNGGELRNASRVVPHPLYAFPHYDIALIKVSTPFCDEKIATLPQQDQTWPANTRAVMVAWGGFTEDVLTVLKSSEVTMLSDEDCGAKNLGEWFAGEQICVVSDDPTSGLCDGDFGAPLLVNDTLIAGINSFNFCGNSTVDLDRFVNIPPLVEWISDNML